MIGAEKFFFVVFPQDTVIKPILDSIKAIADPQQKSPSHVTVKGPYFNEQRKRLLEDSQSIKGKEIRVVGIGNFFSENQNTVFFRCEDNRELYSIWKTKNQKTYKEFNPHITIYDGKDSIFAHKLFQKIDSHKLKFQFIMNELEIYKSSKIQPNIFTLRTQVDYLLLSQIAKYEVNKDTIENLSSDERILIIDRLCAELKNRLVSKKVKTSHSYQPYLGKPA